MNSFFGVWLKEINHTLAVYMLDDQLHVIVVKLNQFYTTACDVVATAKIRLFIILGVTPSGQKNSKISGPCVRCWGLDAKLHQCAAH